MTSEFPLPLIEPIGIDREVRVLTPEEIQTLAPIFEAQGASLPNPAHSFMVGAVEDGKVVGFLTVQLRVHAEPMYLGQGHEYMFRALVRLAEKTLVERTGGGVDVFLFAPAGKVARLAEVAGMRAEPWVVYSTYVEQAQTQAQAQAAPEDSNSEPAAVETVQ